MLVAYKYRLYPNKTQEEQIQKTFGCVRFVYNKCLAYKEEKHTNEKIILKKFDCNNWKNQVLKKEYPWLKEVDKFALDNAIIDMDFAYQMFFKKHAGFPKFKSKKQYKKSYKTNCNYSGRPTIEINFDNNKVKLPKLKWVKCKLHRQFEGKVKSATISQVPSGKYFVSILVETEIKSMESTGAVVGIDLGIKDLVITSDGEKFDNLKLIKKYEDKLVKEQRKLQKKVKGSNNYNKQRIKVAKIHEKISNCRKDYLHKISHKLISENQVIVSEDLSIKGMIADKNGASNKNIHDCGWFELTRQLQYKSDWYNRNYIKVDRYFASSQICSCCGYKNPETKDFRNVKEWICPKCNSYHDRDINAAINILNEGLRLLKAS